MNYTITKIKTFIGREGYGLNATICKDGKPVAFVSDDASGGDVRIDFRNPLQTATSFNASKDTWQDEETACLRWALNWYLTDAGAEPARKQNAELESAYPHASRGDKTERQQSWRALEDWINCEVDAQELAKKQAAQLKRWAKTQTVFRLKGDEAGTYRTLKAPVSNPGAVPAIVKKYGADKIEMIYGFDLSKIAGAAC